MADPQNWVKELFDRADREYISLGLTEDQKNMMRVVLFTLVVGASILERKAGIVDGTVRRREIEPPD